MFPWYELKQHGINNGIAVNEIDEWEIAASLIFPRIKQWREQYHDVDGDDSDAAYNFLYHTLPFLAVVVIQNGIYWVRDYPTHEFARLRLHAMPPWYARWAAAAPRQCDQMRTRSAREQVNRLNQAALAAFGMGAS